MNRLTILPLLAVAGLVTACTTAPGTAAPPTVTEAVTSPASAPAASSVSAAPAADTPEPDANPLPCAAVHVEAAIGDGSPNQDQWNTDIVLTNLGPQSCRLDGASKLELFTGGDGRPLGIHQVMSAEGAGDLAVLDVGDTASMGVSYPTAEPGTRPDCLEGGSFAQVTLDGDSDVVEAWPPDPQVGLPPVCGAVTVTSWLAGPA